MAKPIEQLRLSNLTFGFDGRKPVFEHFMFTMPNVPLIWMHGRPGMGKSSLLKIFAGLLTPQSGQYFIDDVDVCQLSFKEFLPYRLQIGYSFDTGGLLSNRSVYENLLLPLRFHKLCRDTEAHERVSFWLDRFRLTRVKNERPFAITGSQRKCVVLLRAFIHYPRLVLLDDATAGLKEDGLQALEELVGEAFAKNGLKHLMFCSEQALPVRQIAVKKVELSEHAKAEAS